MAKNNLKSNFSIQVSPYDGSSSVKFFFSIIRDCANVNSWTKEQTILFLKSKLTGQALQFLIESQLAESDDIDTIQTKFQDFFGEKPNESAFNDFNNLKLAEEETIKNFAHKLNVITRNAYPDITDQTAIDSIKLNKFLNVLPINLRIKLREEKIKNFEAAISRASELREIMQSELRTQDSSAQCFNIISTNLANLTNKVDALAQANAKHSQTPQDDKHINVNTHNRDYQTSQFKTRFFSSGNTHRFGNNRHRNHQNIICQICSKQGHAAVHCFKYTNLCKRSRQYTDHSRPRGRFGSNNGKRYFQQEKYLN